MAVANTARLKCLYVSDVAEALCVYAKERNRLRLHQASIVEQVLTFYINVIRLMQVAADSPCLQHHFQPHTRKHTHSTSWYIVP